MDVGVIEMVLVSGCQYFDFDYYFHSHQQDHFVVGFDAEEYYYRIDVLDSKDVDEIRKAASTFQDDSDKILPPLASPERELWHVALQVSDHIVYDNLLLRHHHSLQVLLHPA